MLGQGDRTRDVFDSIAAGMCSYMGQSYPDGGQYTDNCAFGSDCTCNVSEHLLYLYTVTVSYTQERSPVLYLLHWSFS